MGHSGGARAVGMRSRSIKSTGLSAQWGKVGRGLEQARLGLMLKRCALALHSTDKHSGSSHHEV